MWFGVLGPLLVRDGESVTGVPAGRQRVLPAPAGAATRCGAGRGPPGHSGSCAPAPASGPTPPTSAGGQYNFYDAEPANGSHPAKEIIPK
jgi:hypothetical protein